MNTRKHSHNAGFTLVEILIVVVILGILSAIVIPQFTSASDTAKANALTTQLQTIRSQLELYRVQHNDVYPTLTQLSDWSVMTEKTNADGTTTGTPQFGPYLQKAPVNSFNNLSNCAATASTSTGWQYVVSSDKSSYTIKGILTTAQIAASGLSTDGGDIVEVASSE